MIWRPILLVCVLCGSADAGDKDKADVLFKQGKKLLGEKRYADACQAFEESNKLDPGIGVEANVALCYEEWGKLARAYRAYAKAEEMAKGSGDTNRASKLHERLAGIEPQVPKLTVKLPAGANAPQKMTLDGATLDATELGKPQLVDPGPHLIEYVTDSGKKHTVVPVERGGHAEYTLEIAVEKKPDHDKEDKPIVEPEQDPGKYWKYGAYAAAGAGGLLIVISSYMALSALSQYNDALAKDCMNSKTMCDSTGLSATHDARHEANVATVLFLVGTAAVGGGVALYLLAPHADRTEKMEKGEALYLVPTATPDGAGIVVGGRF